MSTPERAPSDRAVVTAAAALLAVPVVVDLAASDRRRPFGYAAADAFYYLQVARNWATHGTISFDGTRPTNGFHPLWQALLTPIYAVTDALGLGRDGALVGALLVELVLLVAAVLLLARVLRSVHGHVTAWFAFVPIGAYALLLAPIWIGVGALDAAKADPFEGPLPLYGTWWSFVNGMESACAIVAFVAVLWACVRAPDERAWGVVLGLALAVMTLSRLDTGVVAVGIVLAFGFVAWRRRDPRLTRGVLLALAAFAVVLGAYILWNLAYAGEPLPVSGTLKSTFPRPTLGNYRDFRSLLEGNTLFAPERLYRHAPVLGSGAFAVAWLVTVAARGRRRAPGHTLDAAARYRVALTGAAVGVLALAVYDWFFVPGFNQGHWYWPVSVVFVTLVTLEWLSGPRLGRVVARPAVGWAVVAVALVLGTVMFTGLQRRDGYHRRFADFFYTGSTRMAACLGTRGPALLAVDDGIDAYSLDVPAMSGTGFALDPDGAVALEEHRLVGLAYRRGFRRVTSVVYFDNRGVRPGATPGQLRAAVAGFFPGEDLSGYDFSLECFDPGTRFAAIRMTRR